MSYLKRYNFLVYKIEFEIVKKILPPVTAAVAHKLKRWGCSTPAPGLRGANGSTPPRRGGRSKGGGGRKQNQNGENLRTYGKDRRKSPKSKRNHKQNASTIKLYRLMLSVPFTPEKFHVWLNRECWKHKTVASARWNAYCSLIGHAGNQYFVPLIIKVVAFVLTVARCSQFKSRKSLHQPAISS